MDRGAQFSRLPFSCLHGADVGAGGERQRGGGGVGGNRACEELEDRRAAADIRVEGLETEGTRGERTKTEVHTEKEVQRQGTDCTRAQGTGALSTRAGDESEVGGRRRSGDGGETGNEGTGAAEKTPRWRTSRWTSWMALMCFKTGFSLKTKPSTPNLMCLQE
jgi:hypothetical protein